MKTTCECGHEIEYTRADVKNAHYVLCGDATVITDVEKLMGGEKAELCFTSPPYADLRDYNIGDFNWSNLMNGVWATLIGNVTAGAHILVNLGIVYRERKVYLYWQNWLEYAEASGYPLFGWYVWDKGFGMCGDAQGRLAPTHEFLFHFNKETESARKWVKTHTKPKAHHTFRQKDGSLREATSPDKIGQPYKIPDSVIRITKETANKTDHPAPYPVAFAEFGINTWSVANNIAYDPFGGSGSTLIACEKLGRRCYMMEIDEHYCDVIIQRWQNYTGKQAIKL